MFKTIMMMVFLSSFWFSAVYSTELENVAYNASNAVSEETPKANQTGDIQIPITPPGITDDEMKLELHHCPFIWELTKIGLRWVTKNGKWRSPAEYLADSIDYFRGAQWSGVVVGEVICLYQGKESFDFPIVLQPIKTILVPEPTGNTWIKKTSDRKTAIFKSCESNDVMECPFYTQEKILAKDIYETIKYREENRN